MTQKKTKGKSPYLRFAFCPAGFLPCRDDFRLRNLRGKRRDAAKLAMARTHEAAVEYINAKAVEHGPMLTKLERALATEETKFKAYSQQMRSRLIKLFATTEVSIDDSYYSPRSYNSNLFPQGSRILDSLTRPHLDDMRKKLEDFCTKLQEETVGKNCKPPEAMKAIVKDPKLAASLDSFTEGLGGS